MNQDVQGWIRLTQITNNEIEQFRLNSVKTKIFRLTSAPEKKLT